MKLSDLFEASTDEKWVVIGNAGRGKQTCWPKAVEPGVYSKAEAEKIVKDLSSKQTAFNASPGSGHTAWHAKPLSKAMEYVSMGNACYQPLKDLCDSCN